MIFNPIGLGLVGYSLAYHKSWVVLAVAEVFVTFGSLSLIPITVNYICKSQTSITYHFLENNDADKRFLGECFTKNPAEASITSNCFRLIFGLTVAFYINEWVADVTVKWVFGMMAFFDILAFGFIGILMWKGHQIREWTVGGLNITEEGEKVVETASEIDAKV